MNKLAFFGVVILGLALLVTHWLVTLVIGVGPQFITSSYNIMRDVDEIKKVVWEEMVKYRADVIKDQLKDDAIKRIPLNSEEPLIITDKNDWERFDQNVVEKLIEKVTLERRVVKLPRGSGTIPGPTYTYEVDTWVAIYGLIGSLLIISGTSFLAIALLKRLKTTRWPDE